MSLSATAAAYVTREEYDALRATLLALTARVAELEQRQLRRRVSDYDDGILVMSLAACVGARVFSASDLNITRAPIATYVRRLGALLLSK